MNKKSKNSRPSSSEPIKFQISNSSKTNDYNFKENEKELKTIKLLNENNNKYNYKNNFNSNNILNKKSMITYENSNDEYKVFNSSKYYF